MSLSSLTVLKALPSEPADPPVAPHSCPAAGTLRPSLFSLFGPDWPPGAWSAPGAPCHVPRALSFPHTEEPA